MEHFSSCCLDLLHLTDDIKPQIHEINSAFPSSHKTVIVINKYNTKKLYCPAPGNSFAAFVKKNTSIKIDKLLKQYVNLNHDNIKTNL